MVGEGREGQSKKGQARELTPGGGVKVFHRGSGSALSFNREYNSFSRSFYAVCGNKLSSVHSEMKCKVSL